MRNTVNKRALALLLAFALAFGGPPAVEANAQGDVEGMENESSEAGYEWEELSDGTLRITKYNYKSLGSDGTVKVPAEISGKKVTEIGEDAFFNRKSSGMLVGVEMPEGVVRIGNYAFSGCRNLSTIKIPASVTDIKTDAFSGCVNLTDIIVAEGNSVYTVRDGDLYRNNDEPIFQLAVEIYEPREKEDGTLEITDYHGNGGDITVPSRISGKNVTGIGNSAFSCHESLTSVELPEGVTAIGDYAFEDCTNLVSLNMPASMTAVGKYAFWGCSGLASIRIPGGMTTIGDYAFSNCSGLKDAEISDGVTTIGSNAFQGCVNLVSLSIPASVTNIGYHAFSECDNLTEIKIAEGNSVYTVQDGRHVYSWKEKEDGTVEITGYSFGKGGDITLPSKIEEKDVSGVGKSAFIGCRELTGLKIPSGVTTICDYAFSDCYNLISVTIPKSVTSIGEGIFFRCNNLADVKIETGNANYMFENGILYGNEKKEVLFCEKGIVGEVQIAEGAMEVKDFAFSGCTGITGIKIPESVTTIGNSVFSGCSGLTNIKIPESVTTIEDWVFSGCSGLTDIELSEHVTTIGDRAFYNCSSLTELKIPKSITSIGMAAFGGSGIKQVALPGTVARVTYHQFGSCTALETAVLEEGIESVDETAFSECMSLKQITIPQSVTKIHFDGMEARGLWKQFPNLTILCHENSAAHQYAVKYEIPFRLLSSSAHTHTPVTDPAVAATCAKEGRTKGSHCSVCGQVLEALRTIPKTAHSYQPATVKASLGKDGSVAQKCSVCGASTSTAIYAPKDILLSQTSYPYDGKVKFPTVTVKDRRGTVLKERMDYKVSYPAGRKNIGSYAVTVTFKGNYEGTAKTVFQIAAKKGTTFTNTYKYKITGDNTVSVTGLKNKKASKVTVPGKVTYGGKSFQVTSIADKAFQRKNITEVKIGNNVKTIGASAFEGCAKLKKATLGKGVAKIEKKAFRGCKRLKNVTIESGKLKTVGKDAFRGIHKNAKIKVPKKKLSAYKKLLKNKGQGKKVKIVK